MDVRRPLFIPIVLGTTRRGRMSAAAATLMVREIGNRRGVATELIDIATVPMPVDDAGEGIKDSGFAARMAGADGLVIVTREYNHGYPGLLKHVLDSPVPEVRTGGVTAIAVTVTGACSLLWSSFNASSWWSNRSPGARGRVRQLAFDKPLSPFFFLVLGLSIPFWIFGAVVEGELLPGLPLAALAFLCPVTAASIILYQRNGAAGVAALLARSLDFKRITDPVWYIPILLLTPAVFALSYGVTLVLGWPLHEPQFGPLAIPALLVAFFIGGLAEELGWSGYAIDPMQHRWGALRAALALGAFWAVWHWVPLLQADRGRSWIAWWSLSTVSLRVLHVWLYNNTGRSVFGQALFHATANLAWQLFPNAGSHYDPAITGPILSIAAALVTGRGWLQGRPPPARG